LFVEFSLQTAGKALKELQKPNEDTPLQEKLENLAERKHYITIAISISLMYYQTTIEIARVGLCAAILIFVVLVVKLAVLTCSLLC